VTDPVVPPPPAVYDELSLFRENADEAGLAWSTSPTVARVAVALPGPPHARTVSALRWGPTNRDVDLVLVHGSSQNAHTWDTVCLAARAHQPDVTILAVDLPGHGRSSWRDDQAYDPRSLATDIAALIERQAPLARLVVGMSLGGITVMALAQARPDLVRALTIIDVTPGVTREKAKAIFDFVNGPQQFDSFEALLERTLQHNPSRSPSSLRRGILHNAAQQPDGSWKWRYDRRTPHGDEIRTPAALINWDDLAGLTQPITLVRGGVSPVVTDDDVAEWRRRRPDDTVIVVDGAGHSIQGDKPVELAAIISSAMAGRLG
jgi:pimeloyl-ACP methyl ester carboxylesterase